MNKLETNLRNHGQDHVLRYFAELDKNEAASLVQDVARIDLDLLDSVPSTSDRLKTLAKINKEIQPVPEELIINSSAMASEARQSHEERGLELIGNGQLAVILLGLDFQGDQALDIPSCKTMLQLQAERLTKIKSLAVERFKNPTCSLPWYILTTPTSSSSIRNLLKENCYFGLDEKDTILFEQEMLPCLDDQGKICMSSKSRICSAPNGSGGLLSALTSHLILDDMSKRGVEHVHIFGTENVLAKIADPVFAGICAERGVQCAAKVFERTSRWDVSDLVCAYGHQSVRIVDGSLVSKQNMSKTKLSTDSLVFNIVDAGYYHLTLPYLESIRQKHDKLSYYKIKKQGFLLNETGRVEKAHYYQLEKKLWDLFPPNLTLVKVSEKQEYSKRIENLIDLHVTWFEAAGGRFQYSGSAVNTMYRRNDQHSSKDLPVFCEISPLVSYSGEGLEELVKNRSFETPIVFDLDEATGQVTFNGLPFDIFNREYPTELAKNTQNA